MKKSTIYSLVNLLTFTQFVQCRDFYLGMFRKNDFLVAQDNIYKAASPFGYTTASYGRFFKCPISYFRIVDRLGLGRGPITTIVRGGLRKKYITVRIKSTYKLPVSVNIYVGCENKKPSTFRTTQTTTTLTTTTTTTTTAGVAESNATTIAESGSESATNADSGAATADQGGATNGGSGAGDATDAGADGNPTDAGGEAAAETTPEAA